MKPFQNEDDIANVVRGFESCTTAKGDFKHQDHLTVAVAYLQELTVPEATNRLRESLLRFVDHHGVDRQKYNETITVFWLELVAAEVKKLKNKSLVEKCNAVIEMLNDAGVVLQYYSSDLLFSQDARQGFVEPDLKSWK